MDWFRGYLQKFSRTDTLHCDRKFHLPYLKSYFSVIVPKTVVIEEPYVDKDYIEDYSGYFSRCFHSYERFCSRLHFFSKEFDEEFFFETVLKCRSNPESKESLGQYFGFIVVKPLPFTFFGKSCLIPYSNQNGRNYPTLREYSVDIFGLQLKINSLAYQEQDSVIGACATKSMWVCFQKTSVEYGHYAPSSYEISQQATKTIAPGTRQYPTLGLKVEEVINSIKENGLAPFVVEPKSMSDDERNAWGPFGLMSHVYAYLKAGLPIILAVFRYKDKPVLSDKPSEYHAITLVGYKEKGFEYKEKGTEHINLVSSAIGELYCHDDQIGPFASINQSCCKDYFVLECDTDKGLKKMYFKPDTIIIPIYHKIRIPFSIIYSKIKHFQQLLLDLRNLCPDRDDCEENDSFNYTWDIYLSSVSEYRDMIINSRQLSKERKKQLISENCPKYLWIATAYSNCECNFSIVFDATDFDHGNCLLKVIDFSCDDFVCIKEIIYKGFTREWMETKLNPPAIGIVRYIYDKEDCSKQYLN